ncbi:MAG: rod shape-determining protein MreD [Pseudomonadota bacterium]|jgi:rod shape-determining protein MreD
MAFIQSGTMALGWRLWLPALITLLLMAVLHVPTPDQALTRIGPAVPLMFTYYWVIQRPRAAPLLLVFFIALLGDLWCEGVVGITVLLALFLRLTLAPHQEAFRVAPFVLRWLAFAVILVLLFMAKWMLLSLLEWHWIAARDLLFQAVVTIALYPLFNRLYALIDRHGVLGRS